MRGVRNRHELLLCALSTGEVDVLSRSWEAQHQILLRANGARLLWILVVPFFFFQAEIPLRSAFESTQFRGIPRDELGSSEHDPLACC
jgi:hypothetical protein